MKQKLLLMVLAFGMFNINVNAQAKKYNVEDDGFEWYEVGEYPNKGVLDKFGNTLIPKSFEYISYDKGIFKVNKENKYGAFDTRGNMIIPTEYDRILNMRDGISVEKDESRGIYNKYGRCLIPVSRGYKEIFPFGSYWECFHTKYGVKGKRSICDASGKVVFISKTECNGVYLQYDSLKQKYALIRDSKYFIDKDDNVVYDPQCYSIVHPDGLATGDIDNIAIKKFENGRSRRLTQVEKSKVIFSGDFLKGNKEYFASLKKINNHQNSLSKFSPSSKSSNNSNSSNSSSNNTTTVHVEHHRDPVPVQEWQACIGCGGMGTMGCDFCGGSGTRYIGDRLHRCSRCNGQGIIPCNVCYGNKGQYITVYR